MTHPEACGNCSLSFLRSNLESEKIAVSVEEKKLDKIKSSPKTLRLRTVFMPAPCKVRDV